MQTQPSDAAAKSPQGRVAGWHTQPNAQVLAEARALIEASSRPVLIAGHAVGKVRELAERLRAPVLTTFKAKGLIPDTHLLGAEVLGRSGTPGASWLMNESDPCMLSKTPNSSSCASPMRELGASLARRPPSGSSSQTKI